MELSRVSIRLKTDEARETSMTNTQTPGTVREAVGLFATADTLQAAIDDLLSSGFDRAELSLLASEEAIESELGHTYRKVGDLEDDDRIPREAYVSQESIGDAEGGLVGGLMYVGAVATAGAIVASGGAVAAMINGAILAGGAGALIGTALATLVGDLHARHLQDHLDRGGLLLWVNIRDAEHEKRAMDILKRHSGQDVHVHDLSADG